MDCDVSALTAVLLLMRMQVFWDVTLCHWASRSGRFQGQYCPHVQGEAVQEEFIVFSLARLGNA
jgi:hypothetical protein